MARSTPVEGSPAAHPRPHALWPRLRAVVPRGGSLPDGILWRRHRTLLTVLWAHVPGLVVFGLLHGHPAVWAAAAAVPPALLAAGASLPWRGGRRVRPALAAMGLLASSASLVALWHGAPEAHFHFFVMLALVGLYLDWLPFLLAVAFVLLQHGLTGTVAPRHVFGHVDGTADAWGMALVHVLFVAAVAVVTVAGWSYHEDARREAQERAAASAALRTIAEAVAHEAPPERLLPLALRALEAIVHPVTVAVGRAEGIDTRLVATAEGHDPDGSLEMSGDPAVVQVRRHGAPARIADEEAGLLHIAAPIPVHGEVWGVVLCTLPLGPPPTRDAEQRVADAARLLGMGIGQAAIRAELEAQARQDPLTGLANHRVFHERLHEEVARARETGEPLALVLCDLDHFKRVNDTHGHPAGDAVLVEMARRLRMQARGDDLVARTGGEEFAWILPGCSGEAGLRRAEDLRRAVASTPFPVAGTVTVSAGVCALADAGDAPTMVSSADQALYWAKRQGRDTCVRHSDELGGQLEGLESAERAGRVRAFETLRTLVRSLDAKHPTTRRHSERVADLAAALATALGWPVPRCVELHGAGLLHDLGTVTVPDTVLLAPGPLTDAEHASIAAHAALGAQIAAEALGREAVGWIRAHHERPDGSGYPDGLRGHAIPEGARILAVADAWDAMTAGRPHRPRREVPDALAELRRHAGTQFAPEVVDALTRLLATGALEVLDPRWVLHDGGTAAPPPVAARASARADVLSGSG